MNQIYNTLMQYLRDEDKEQAVLYVLDIVKQKQIKLMDLYEKILAPSLNEIECAEKDPECIWKEHVRTAIIRTIIESIYPYFVQEKQTIKKVNKKVIVACPQEEYHEIGARIVSDLFELAGFESTFIGANTPIENLLSAITIVKPDYFALSVTNYYNVVVAKKLIDIIKKQNPSLKIICGGRAFQSEDAKKIVSADYFLQSYQDILHNLGDMS